MIFTGVPMRPRGLALAMASPARARVAAIMWLWKGPGAMALTRMFSGASRLARWRVSMMQPALEVE